MLRFDTDETRTFWREACAATAIEPATTYHSGTFAEPTTPFDQVAVEFAAPEGEGDLSVAHWRGAHINYFKSQCKRWGQEWRDDRPIVCESFELAYRP
jgi:hypothetical protein